MQRLDSIRELLTQRLAVLPVGTRWAVVALMICLLAASVLLLRGGISESQSYLFDRDLTTDELARMRTALAKANLNDYVVDGRRIKVPTDRRNKYFAAVADAKALPYRFGDSIPQIVAQTGLLTPQSEKEKLYLNALQVDLAQIISRMKGIGEAMVLLGEQREGGLRPKVHKTASVSVRTLDHHELSGQKVVTIRHLVADAVGGLEADQVSVTDLSSGRVFPPGKDPLARDNEKPASHADFKEVYERQWTAKIRHGLSWIDGLLVSVDVTLARGEFDKHDFGDGSEAHWTPGRVKVAIAVPDTHVERQWQKKYGGQAHVSDAVAAVQLQQLRDGVQQKLHHHVANLIPQTAGGSNSDFDIQITFFDAEDPAIAVAKPASPFWNSQNTALAGGALCVLIVILLLLTKSGAGPVEIAEPSMDETSTPAVPAAIDEFVTSKHREQPLTNYSEAILSSSTAQKADFATPKQGPSRLTPSGDIGGIELNDWVGSQLGGDHAGNCQDRTHRLTKLDEIEPVELAGMLTRENPQVVAIVFSHLQPDQAAAVLQLLPTSLRIAVVRRLSNLGEMSDEVIHEIEDGLEQWLADQLRRTQRRNAGVRAVSNILEATDAETKSFLLEQLRREDVGLTRQLQSKVHAEQEAATERSAAQSHDTSSSTFEDVIRLDDETLHKVFNATDPQTAALALAGVTREVVQRLTRKMQPPQADRLRTAMRNVGAADLFEIESSQREIVQLAAKFKASGKGAGTNDAGQLSPISG